MWIPASVDYWDRANYYNIQKSTGIINERSNNICCIMAANMANCRARIKLKAKRNNSEHMMFAGLAHKN